MQATFKITTLKYRKRQDGTFGVYIRIGLKSQYTYIATPYSVGKTELNRNGEIKNGTVIDGCNAIISEYRGLIAFAGDLSDFDVKMVRDFIMTRKEHKDGLNYSRLFRKYLVENKNSPSIGIANTTYNHITRFSGHSIMVNDITPDFLSRFERFLSGMDTMGSRGVNLYLSTVRKIYRWIMDEYEYKGYTFRYPFRKYKIPKAKYKPTIALTKEQLLAIMTSPIRGAEANRARDAFVISLLTLGMNAKDMYELEKIGNRIDYNRSKTRKKRDDDAFISIRIEPELKPYLKKYSGKKKALSFADTHKNMARFRRSISDGMKSVEKQINRISGYEFITGLEFYDARRTVASVMRNKLKISKDDVAKCLNHVDTANRITDIYIERDFSVLDRCNRKFIDWLYDIK